MKNRKLGIIYGLLSALYVSAYVTTNRYIYGNFDIGAVEYSALFAICGAVYASVSFAYQLNAATLQKVRENYKSLLLLGGAGFMAAGIFVIGQQYTSAINASILMTTTIIATAIFSHLLLQEHHAASTYAWMLMLFFGLYISIVGLGSITLQSGDAIVLGSVVFFGFGNAYSRKVMLRIGSASLVPDVRLIIGGLLSLVVALVTFDSSKDIFPILPYALTAGLFYWLTMKTFARSVYLLNAHTTIVLNNTHIFVTSLTGVVLLSEQYSFEKFIGSVAALLAIYMIARVRTKE